MGGEERGGGGGATAFSQQRRRLLPQLTPDDGVRDLQPTQGTV